MLNPFGNGPYVKTPWFRKVKSSFHAHKRVLAAWLCILIALGLVVLGYGDFPIVKEVRTKVTDLFTPSIELSRAPENLVESLESNISAFIQQKDQILELRAANKKLQEAQLWARQIQHENAELRTLLKIPQERYKIVTHARVLSYPGAPYTKSILLGVGKQQGVAPLQAVITPQGLVGRVVDVGDTSCRVILITDLNAQIPVILKPGNVHAILAGNNTQVPRLKYIQDVYGPIGVGDTVETSASEGVFPAGLAIGIVKKIEGEHVLIKPAVDLENLKFVTIIKPNEVADILGGES